MKTPHKHAEIIKAWADGAEIECRNKNVQDVWEPMTSSCWDLKFLEFRIKLEPKPDHVYYGVFDMDGSMHLESCFTKINDDGDQIKLTFDGETGQLKAAEML